MRASYVAVLVLVGCATPALIDLPPVDSPEFDGAIVMMVNAHHEPIQHECEYSVVAGIRMWEHVDVIGNDGTYYTIEYPNRERELSGRRKGMMQEKRIAVAWKTIGPCVENMFTPTAQSAGPPR